MTKFALSLLFLVLASSVIVTYWCLNMLGRLWKRLARDEAQPHAHAGDCPSNFKSF